jgi:hypothetical protein
MRPLPPYHFKRFDRMKMPKREFIKMVLLDIAIIAAILAVAHFLTTH